MCYTLTLVDSITTAAQTCILYLDDHPLILLFFENVVHWKGVNLLSNCLRDCWQEMRGIQIQVIAENLSKLLRSYQLLYTPESMKHLY